MQIPEVVSLGSDCTGLGTEVIAAELCGIPYKIIFGSEINPHVRHLHKLLHPTAPPLGVDCTQDVLRKPTVDLYVAGPPCQPWSAIGQQKGLKDFRGTVFYHVLEFVRVRQPRAVLIENVRGLLDRHADMLSDVLHMLKASGYCATWDILDTKDHGIPQSRPRLLIVGIRADSCAHTFKFPKKLKMKPSMDLFLHHGKPYDWDPLRLPPTNATARRNLQHARAKMVATGINPASAHTFIDVFASKKFASLNLKHCPCITASRSKAGGFYISHLNRMTYYLELGRLQGFPTDKLRTMLSSNGVKHSVVGHAIGNAISVNILMRILPRLLVAAGLVQQSAVRADVWKKTTKAQVTSMNILPDDIYYGELRASARQSGKKRCDRKCQCVISCIAVQARPVSCSDDAPCTAKP